jgi:hypothetical protein
VDKDDTLRKLIRGGDFPYLAENRIHAIIKNNDSMNPVLVILKGGCKWLN